MDQCRKGGGASLRRKLTHPRLSTFKMPRYALRQIIDNDDLIRLRIGLGISDKKIIPRKTELTEQLVISHGILAVPRNRISRNSVPNPSAEEKTSRNSVPRNRNRSKLSEVPSEPFSGRETTRNSVPRNRNRSKLSESLPNLLVEEKTTRNSVPNHSAEEKTTQRQRQSSTVLKLKVLVETVRIGFHHPV
jgi:hypothetical protein